MAETYLIELNHNDELLDIIRKVNSNFKQVYYTQNNKVAQSSRASSKEIENEVTSIRADMQEDFNQIEQDMQALEDRMNIAIANAVNTAKTELRNALTPPIGTMMFSSSNPSNTYSGTTWTQVTQGTVLLSAGAAYVENSKYELADSTLSDGGTLFTACKLWKRTA